MIRPACLAFVLQWEGGYVNHPRDKGGATNKGITQAIYDQWRARLDCAPIDVRHISDPEVASIYAEGYWATSAAGDCAPPLDHDVCDTAVLSGPAPAVRWLQDALSVSVDGVVGVVTRAALATADPRKVALGILDRREATHRQRVAVDQGQAVFLDGWLRRCAALRKEVG